MTELLTDEARAWAGHEYPTKSFHVTDQDILKFCYATGEEDPVHLDPELSASRGYRGLLAPPMFYLAVRTAAYHIAPVSAFAVDGTPQNDLPPIATIRGMGGEISTELHAPICSGDSLTITKRVGDVYEKSGRSGPLVFVSFEFTITNQLDERVVSETFTRAFR